MHHICSTVPTRIHIHVYANTSFQCDIDCIYMDTMYMHIHIYVCTYTYIGLDCIISVKNCFTHIMQSSPTHAGAC